MTERDLKAAQLEEVRAERRERAAESAAAATAAAAADAASAASEAEQGAEQAGDAGSASAATIDGAGKGKEHSEGPPSHDASHVPLQDSTASRSAEPSSGAVAGPAAGSAAEQ